MSSSALRRLVHSRLVRAEQYVIREAVTPLDGRDTNAAPRSVRSPGDLNPIDRRRLPRRVDLSQNQ
jgi:hypothetical protein